MPLTVSLWPDGQVPHALGDAPEDTPTLTLYPPDAPNGTAIIVCPGGGYGVHAPHETEPIARWANSFGALGIVLRYRLGPRYHHPTILGDALQAIRVVRENAAEWGVDPGRIGILGFSAGGHLASTAATWFTGPDDRPDFAILIYPVIAMDGPFSHEGCRTNLLGATPDPALVASLSTHTRVTPQTPPTFLVHAVDDGPVPVQHSLLFAAALAENGVPFGLQIYAHGPHGYALGSPECRETLAWPAACIAWMKSLGLIQ